MCLLDRHNNKLATCGSSSNSLLWGGGVEFEAWNKKCYFSDSKMEYSASNPEAQCSNCDNRIFNTKLVLEVNNVRCCISLESKVSVVCKTLLSSYLLKLTISITLN